MRFNKKPNGAISFTRSSPPLMAPSISSLAFSYTFPSSSSSSYSPSTPNPRRNRGCSLSPRPQTLALSPNSSKNNNNITTPPSEGKNEKHSSSSSEKKSFAVATGELFLGIAARLITSSSDKGFYEDSGSTIPVFDRPRKRINGSEIGRSGNNDKERIGVVMEDEIEPEVIWEQRVKDIEAEKERRVVISPGFSFSAAGLLFLYHL